MKKALLILPTILLVAIGYFFYTYEIIGIAEDTAFGEKQLCADFAAPIIAALQKEADEEGSSLRIDRVFYHPERESCFMAYNLLRVSEDFAYKIFHVEDILTKRVHLDADFYYRDEHAHLNQYEDILDLETLYQEWLTDDPEDK